MSFADTPTLENADVRLEPLALEHAADLADGSADGEIWRTWYTRIPRPDEMEAEIEARLAQQRAGSMAPWAVVDPSSGRAVGMTTFCSIDEPNRRLEIGHTWIRRTAQGTRVNPAAKRVLLARAFEDLGCHAVELRTDWLNRQSRAAIARLGAKQDGVLRRHRIMPAGYVRDTVVLSILDSEWPGVKLGLDARLA